MTVEVVADCRPKPRKTPKKPHAVAPTVLQVVEDELQKAKDMADAATDVQEELNADAAAEMAEEAYQLALRKVGDRATLAQNALPTQVAFHPGLETDFVSALYEVQPTQDQLTRYPVPHRVAVFEFDVLTPFAQEGRDAEGNKVLETVYPETPHRADLQKPKGQFHWVRYVGSVKSYNASEADPVHEERFELEFSLEQWIAARGRKIARGGMKESLSAVRTFRAGAANYGTRDYTRGNDTELNDELFTALLLVDDSAARNGDKLWKDILSKVAANEIQRNIISRHMDEPQVEGTYVRGYRVTLRDLFPQVFHDAVDRLRTGEDVERVSAFIMRQLAGANTGYIRMRDVAHDAERRANSYCRMAPVFIRNVFSCFPDPTSCLNAISGLFKRVLRPLNPATREAAEAEAAVAEDLVDRVVPHRENFDPDEAEAAAEQRSREHPNFSQADRDQYMAGARLAVEAVLNRVKDTFDRVFDQVKVFIKQEAYPASVMKACRYIVAPSPFIRGFASVLFFNAERSFKKAFGSFLVKGLTPESLRVKMKTMFQGFVRNLSSDFSSFESQCSDDRQERTEVPVMVAACPTEVADLWGRLKERLGNDIIKFSSFFGWGWFPNMRLSGFIDTSVGNACVNYCTSFGAMARAAGVSPSKAGRFARAFRNPFLIEGDDGVFALPPEVTETALYKAYAEAGCVVTRSIHDDYTEAEFCSQSIVEKDGTLRCYKDPLQCLANVTSWMGCDATTKKRDMEMLVAKCMSYGKTFPGLPIVGPFMAAVIKENRKLKDAIVSHLSDGGWTRRLGEKGVAGAKFLRSQYNAVTSWLSPTEEIWIEMRERVHREYPELDPQTQISIEKRIVEAVRAGVSEIVIPELENIWARMYGATKMTVRKFEGTRAAALEALSAWKTRVAAKQVLATGMGLVKASYFLNGLMAVLVSTGMVFTVLSGWGWLMFTICPLLMSLMALVLAFATVLLGTLVLHMLFGLSWRHSRWVMQVGVWTLTAMVGLMWFRFWWTVRAAVARRRLVSEPVELDEVDDNGPPPPPGLLPGKRTPHDEVAPAPRSSSEHPLAGGASPSY